MTAERWLAAAAAACLGLSLSLPAIQGSGFPSLSGFDVLRQGAGAWRDSVVAWYANPLLAAALVAIFLRRFRLGLAFAIAGTLLALSSFGAAGMAERAGRTVPAFSYAAGFYVWLLAFAIAIAAAAVGIYKVSRRHRSG